MRLVWRLAVESNSEGNVAGARGEDEVDVTGSKAVRDRSRARVEDCGVGADRPCPRERPVVQVKGARAAIAVLVAVAGKSFSASRAEVSLRRFEMIPVRGDFHTGRVDVGEVAGQLAIP